MSGRRQRRRANRNSRRRRPESLRPWVRRFLTDYLPGDRGASPNTVVAYAHSLKLLVAFLSRQGSKRRNPKFSDLTAESVLAFLAELERSRKNGSTTRNVRLAALLSFLRFAFLMGRLEEQEYERMRLIPFKRCSRRIVSYLEPFELDAVFRAADHRTRDGFRDLTVLKLMYNTGARASEVAGLKVSDLALDGLRLSVVGKGRKERACGLWESTAVLIRIYLASERRIPRKGFEDYLFINQRATPFTRFGIHDLVRRYAARAAKSCESLARKTVTPHTIRHTTAVHLLASGVDLNTIRDWLGHSHMATTEIYAQVDLQRKRLALAKLRDLDAKLIAEITKSRGHAELDVGIRRWLESLPE